jgi:N-acetyl-anhydromuramyl-L-alanine amidase AmpD
MSEIEHLLQTGVFYPDAIKFHKGKKMRVRGDYAKGFPIGAIVHSTDGRPNDGADSTLSAVKENSYAYFVIGRGGKVFQSFSLTQWGSHAGPTLHPDLGGNLSQKLVGIEIVSAGKLVKIDDDRFRPWYNKETKKPQDDFPADDVRFREKVGTPTKVGYQTAGHYHKFTDEQEAALINLLMWMRQHEPNIFRYENVFGHDEVAIHEGMYGRKTDPGACLSITMAQLRHRLMDSD